MFRQSLFAGLFVTLAVTMAAAHGYKLGALEIGHPWSRATPKGAKLGSGYFKVTNNGKEADRLTGGSAEFAERVEIHQMTMDKGVMQMRPLPQGIEIKPGATVEFTPGSYHLMFVNLKKPLEKGERVKGKLTFEKAGSVDVEYAVEDIGASPKGEHSGHSM